MNDINVIIEMTVKATGQPEELVEKIVRSMYSDIQEFTSKKKGMNIQIPQVGTFVFRASAIPNYINKTKSILAHWISRLFIGEHKGFDKTIIAAKNNIAHCFYSIEHAAKIKKEYLENHSKYKPRTKAYLEDNDESDLDRVLEYMEIIQKQLFISKDSDAPEEDLPNV